MEFLRNYTAADLLNYFTPREGETKIGQDINLGINGLQESIGHYVLIGIPEDIGVRANYGNSGAYNGWDAFLSKFLSMQSNSLINANDILIGGEIKVDDLLIQSDETSVEELRRITEIIDLRVQTVIEEIIELKKIPIVIGGGHNNCYPIINSFNEPISVLNIDPHADLRILEGRHSGNGFSYALENGSLERYFVLGLHEEYNSEQILSRFRKEENLSYLSLNEILAKGKNEIQSINIAKNHLKRPKIGLEIDLDSIKNMPVSAMSPIGLCEEQLRTFVIELSKEFKFHYLHICEGAPTNEVEKIICGKTIAYLVSDFIKCNSGTN